MNNDQKRFRQISIKEGFALTKKTKINAIQAPTMEKNLRNLMAAAAESRRSPKKNKSILDDIDEINLNGNCQASTSKDPTTSIKPEVQDSEENCMSYSAELFTETQENISDSLKVEQCSSQEEESFSITEPNSSEIFSEVEETETDPQLCGDDSDSEEKIELSFFNRKPKCSLPLPPLAPSENHAIMFSPHIQPGSSPRPYPTTYRDRWDGNHVRMPCSPFNKYPVENLNGEKEIQSRWDLICKSLRRPINSSQDLVNAIMQYNSQYRSKWNFNNLCFIIDKLLTEEEKNQFFNVLLPLMIAMALDLPNICTQPLPLLKKNRDYYLTLSQKQIGCLLLNAFFCTFPRRNITKNRQTKWNHEYSTYPDINFNRLFFGVKNKTSTSVEKLKCLINYFSRICNEEPTGTVTFHRQILNRLPHWWQSNKSVRSVCIKSNGFIESDGHGMLQVDFANKFVGGGVLGHGCVQEEIRFIICAELLVSRLFVECLGSNEVLIVTGAEQYCNYTGYSSTFLWSGSYYDETPRDAWGRRCTEIVAMDATHFTNPFEQFKSPFIRRELNKAYCGFYEDGSPQNLSAVATGNWGCGAFNGNPSLKFVIQLMAASEAGRDMLYFTFGNKALKKELNTIAGFLAENNLVVADLMNILNSYCENVQEKKNKVYPTIYDHLCRIFTNEDSIDDTTPNRQSQDITNSDKDAMEKLFDDIDSSNIETKDSPGA